MKKTVLFSILLISLSSAYAQLNQKSQRIRYFSDHTNPSAWDGGKSYAYYGGGASITNFGNAIPVESINGIQALKIQSTKPSGYWNVIFKISVHSVNYERMGSSPYLYLRLKWTDIANGADLKVELQSYANNKYLDGNNTNETSSVLLSNYISPSNNWQDVYIPISDFQSNNPNLNINRVAFIRLLGEGSYSNTNTMYIENMDVVPSTNDIYTDAAKINQIGYLPNQEKIGLVSFKSGASNITPSNFEIVSVPGNNHVYSGSLTKKNAHAPNWGQDGDDVYEANFSALTSPGTYKMLVPTLNQESQTFTIGNSEFDSKFRDALRFFYYARSGEPIMEPYAEGHTRQAFYENETSAPYDYTSGTRDIKGGWFDAGDLHKDVHAQVETLWYLLETLKSFKDKNGADDLNIPESNQNINDLYYLIKYGLDWMAKMWNTDGSVHFWVNYDDFPGTIGEISDISSGSASTLAGLFAKAYPLFKNESTFSSYADELLEKAEKSWEWLSNNTNNISPINPTNGQEYSYAFSNDIDQVMRLLAAIELFNATGNTNYNDYFVNRHNNPLTDFGGNMSWGGVIQTLEQSHLNLAYLDYINSNQSNVNTGIQNQLKAEFVNLADWSIDRIGYTPYRIPMVADNHMYWGSSANIITYAYLYDQVYAWTANTKYRNAIYDCVDWVMGRNPVNRIFVTGYGDKLHGTDIYSFYWTDIANPPPGYLCGNINAAEPALRPYFEDPWKQYLNLQQASILEPGIYWNAEYAWLMGYMASPKTSVGSRNPRPNSGEFKVFPNPAENYIIIEGKSFDLIEIYDSQGKLISSNQSQNNKIDISNLTSGYYSIKIKCDNAIHSSSFIKK